MAKFRRTLFGILLALVILFSVTAYAAVKQQEAVLNQTEITLDMAGTKKIKLKAKVLPEKASQSVVWKTANKAVAKVSTTGVVTAVHKGETKIVVRPSKIKSPTVSCAVHVIDSLCPDSVSIVYSGSTALEVFDTVQIEAHALPSEKSQAIGYASSNTSIATVSESGLVIAKKAGTVTIKAYSKRDTSVNATITFTITRPVTPSKLLITPADNVLGLNTTLQLFVDTEPAIAGKAVVWSSSSTKIASVTKNGLVTPHKEGTVKIKAKSKFNSKVYTVRTLKIIDPTKPTSISLSLPEGELQVGDTVQIIKNILPATASDAAINWKISDSEVAEITSEGQLHLKNSGRARIVATTVKGEKTAILDIVVYDPTATVSVVTPLRITDVSGISANIARIEAIENSAYSTLDKLQSAGSITASEESDRRNVIKRAFEMQKFVWMTKKTQAYWKKANSEGGAKNFKPGNVYYGLPYTQKGATAANRQYNVTKAVSEGRYTDSGNGYYLLNQNKLLGESYVGNDCSAFVSQCEYVSASHRYDRCNSIISCNLYKRVESGYSAMRPGDIIIHGGYNAHVVMFLYYTNSARTRMMIIEQGGGSAGDIHNTICCSIVNVSKYSGGGYKVMRKTIYK